MVTGLVIVLSLLTRASNAIWKDDETYCQYWVNLNPLNGSAWDCRARAFIRKNDKGLDASRYHNCEEAADLAGTYHLSSKSEKAIPYYLMALSMNDDCLPAYYGLGILYFDMKGYRRSELAFISAINVNPQYFPSYQELIKVYVVQGKDEETDKIRRMLQPQQAEGLQKLFPDTKL